MIQEHYDKYYWSACNYFSFSGLGAESIEGLIQAALKQKGGAQKTLKEMEEQKIELIKEKEKLKNKFTFDEDTKLAFKLMEKAGIVYDKRKKSQMNTFFSLGRILKEIAKRKKIDFDLAKYLLPHELKDFTRGKIKIQTLKDRRKYTFIDFNKTPYEILTLDAAKKAEEDIWKHTDLTQNKKEISGLCASEGRVIAKARIISSVKNLGELKQGEILVTGMTTPDYAVALKKAVGIITDDGGITCHAAIIAREMKIPAIVGTKTATKKVKTGDLIDLRAHHGMARILETTSE
jgi:phosphoenolpyruvate synthase/pyruvate phosphate dikinase